MAHSKKYWEKRAIQLFTTQDKDNDRLTKRLNSELDRVNTDIEKEIASYYSKYGKDGVIEYRKLVVSLSEPERDLLYKNMEAFADKHPEYAYLMPVRESIYKLNRLEGLQLSVRQNMLELGAIEQKEFDKTLAAAYEHGYLSSMKGLENQPAFFKVDKLVMQQTINQKWVNDKNFSDRIWDNKERLINTMNNEIRNGLIRGESYADMTKALRYRTGVGKKDAERLLHTEAAFVLNEANAQAFMDAGVIEYENTAVMDSRTSPTCREMDGQVFKFSERAVGLNAPPYHAWCRTTIIPRESSRVSINENSEYNEGINHQSNALQKVFHEVDNQLENKLQNQSDDWFGQLFKSEVRSINNFSGDWYDDMNGLLRDSNYDSIDNDFIYFNIEKLESALSKFELSDNIVVYRGVSKKEYEAILNGDHFKEFKSTSTGRHIATEFALNKKEPGVVVKINIPKGSDGAYVGENSATKGEKEFLINRGATYEVKEVEGILEVTINGNRKQELPAYFFEDDEY